MINVILTGLLRAGRTQRALVLENLALRHQQRAHGGGRRGPKKVASTSYVPDA